MRIITLKSEWLAEIPHISSAPIWRREAWGVQANPGDVTNLCQGLFS
jgi:hypothetical protein